MRTVAGEEDALQWVLTAHLNSVSVTANEDGIRKERAEHLHPVHRLRRGADEQRVDGDEIPAGCEIPIHRALAQEPVLMILDEPSAFLDWPNRVDLLANLRNIAHDTGKSIPISSHDLELVLQIADEMWVLSGQGGGIEVIDGSALMRSGRLQAIFSSPHGRFDPVSGRFQVS